MTEALYEDAGPTLDEHDRVLELLSSRVPVS
jgi:hypothetical protein